MKRESSSRGDFMRCEGLWEFLANIQAQCWRRYHFSIYRWMAKVYEVLVKPTGVSDALALATARCQDPRSCARPHLGCESLPEAVLDDVIVDDATIEAIYQLALPGTEPGEPGRG